ncbi:hypothetical protein Tsubulata_021830 [Turnera subulata]|uniref:KIB1-4 beta-propeller domain-containing protein n=1 Tax=Turnera subulata TaxID=218843 RepID=A0A9Q0G9S9_9ROSI|nr:hypothetical protein Tsubulata_021830 [Turnera subulata]
MEGGEGEEKKQQLVEGEKGEEEERPSRLQPPALGTNPWLVYSHGKRYRNQSFYDVSGGSCHLKSIPEMRNKLIWNYSYGWLILSHASKDGTTLPKKDRDCSLLNLISMQNIKLPRMTNFATSYVLLSRPPNDPNCYVMCFPLEKQCVIFCKVGDVEWIEKELQDLGLRPDEEDYLGCVSTYDGQIHMLRSNKLFLVEIEDYHVTCTDLQIERSRRPQLSPRVQHLQSMVESSGELFLIYIFDFGRYFNHFEIMKLDSENKKWVSVQNLKDRAIFINLHGGPIASISTKEFSGLKENTIYFTLPEDRFLYHYNLEERRVAICMPCPNVTQNWHQPMWFFP